MLEFGVPEKEAKVSLEERLTKAMTKRLLKDNAAGRREWEQVAKQLVREAAAD